MTNSLAPQRDTRIDVLRALALLTIFIDHVPGTSFDTLTYKNFGFSDAAEAFVLLSGMSVALAHDGRFTTGNRFLQTLKLWRRAGVLYVAHLATTMAAIAIFCLGAVLAKRPALLAEINLEPLMKKTPEALAGIVTLGHQIGYNNILPVYAALLLLTPLPLFTARRWPWLTLAASGLVWLAAGIWQIAPPNYPEAGFWFMNPLSWQFLFTIGLVGAMLVRRGAAVPIRGWAVAAAAAYAAFALVWLRTPFWGVVSWFDLPPVIGGFDKTFLSLSRLLHILSVSYLVIALCSVTDILRRSADHPLVIMGRRSLPVFIAGTLLAMAAQVLRFLHAGGFQYDLMLLATGIAAQFAFAYYLEWLSRLGKAARKEKAGVSGNPARLALSTVEA